MEANFRRFKENLSLINQYIHSFDTLTTLTIFLFLSLFYPSTPDWFCPRCNLSFQCLSNWLPTICKVYTVITKTLHLLPPLYSLLQCCFPLSLLSGWYWKPTLWNLTPKMPGTSHRLYHLLITKPKRYIPFLSHFSVVESKT
jgi:hypothetical protein